MTDLRLGLDLSMTGIVAPRGAARQVYTDSLRRNTDPALLEQSWPSTYKLRVFPVPWNRNEKTQGRQKVQFTYLAPFANALVTLAPQIQVINLSITDQTEVVTKLKQNNTMLVQDSFKANNWAFFRQAKTYTLSNLSWKTFYEYCITPLDTALRDYPFLNVK